MNRIFYVYVLEIEIIKKKVQKVFNLCLANNSQLCHVLHQMHILWINYLCKTLTSWRIF